MKVYPLFLVGLDRRRCVVIGGDSEAERKVSGLLEADAAVTVVAAQLAPALAERAARGQVTWLARDYAEGDLRGAFLVIVVPRDEQVRAAAAAEAAREGALVNVVDDVPRCSFVAGSVVRRGPLVLSISTSGCAPALAVRLREWLEREVGPAHGELTAALGELREPLSHLPFEQRRALWYRIVDAALAGPAGQGR